MKNIYPAEYEKYWIDLALRHFKTSDVKEAILSLEPAVRYLSDQFTIKRTEDFAHYSEDPELLAAYGLFFFPQTYSRMRYPLEEISKFSSWKPQANSPTRILDLGCGLGAASLSIADFLNTPDLKITGWDQSSKSLRHLETLGRNRKITVETQMKNLDLLPIKSKPHLADIVVMSFSLNEIFHTEEPQKSWMECLWNLVDEGGILILLEPALHQTPVRLEKIREFFRQQENSTLLAPCLHAETCPLLQFPKTRCHEVLYWTPPESLATLNKSLYREISHIKFSFLVIQKTASRGASLDQHTTRMISPMIEENGKTIFHGCSGDGKSRRHEVLHRHLSKQEKAALLDIPRGSRIHIGDYQAVGKPEAFRTQKFEVL